MPKVHITADSACDLSPELCERYHIHIAPLHVSYEGKTGLDGVDVTASELFASFYRTGELPKTAAVSPAEFESFFREVKGEGEEIVHLSISSEFSSCHQNAMIAAAEVGGVYCVDSRNLSSGIALLVLKAADFAAEGLSAAEIAERLCALTPKVDASFVLDTLSFLRAGGRCSSLASLGASVLSIKPSILVSDGKMHVGKKYMATLVKAQQKYLADRIAGVNPDRTRVFVTHTAESDPKLIEVLIGMVRETGLFDEILEGVAGATISSHCGPNCMGVLFIHQ